MQVHKQEKVKTILVTGSEGYIGSVLVPLLINKGYDVIGLDIGYYSEANINNYHFPNYQIIKKDLRDLVLSDIERYEFYAIIHLAALSNDPLGMLDEDLTYKINYLESVRLAQIALEANIPRFIYSSSCSLYGDGDGFALTENTEANPQTAYGKSKILAEKSISKLANSNFCPVHMRNATAFGYSPRMRFDLVVNSLSGFAEVDNEIKILGDGTPWRPLVHILDISYAILLALEAPQEKVFNQAFNVGDNENNFQIKTIAETVKTKYPDCQISIAKKDAQDSRNYNVSFDKINKTLNYHSKYSLYDGIIELQENYQKFALSKTIFGHRLFNRLKQIKYLIKNKKIDKELRVI